MTFYLPNYSYGNRLLTVARTEKTFKDLSNRNVDVLYITNNGLLIYPGNVQFDSKEVHFDRFSQLCEYDIVEINENGLVYRAFSNSISDATIFLGGACNSNCIMCPASDAERKKGFSYDLCHLLKYIDYLPSDLEHIVITGGEPTLQTSTFLKVLRKVKEKYQQSQVLLLTNGRSLSDKQLFENVCISCPSNFRIAIPIHGDTSELHDYITRAPGSFVQSCIALERLMKSGIEVEIRIVVTKINCDNLTAIANLVISKFPNTCCVNFIGLETMGNCARNFNTVYLDHRTSFLKSKVAIDRLVSAGINVGLYNYPLCSIDRDYWALCAKSISEYKNVYSEDCSKCDAKILCGGFFTSTLHMAHPSVQPIISEN